MSSYSSSDEEDNLECPLCMEEIDLADKYFKPCVCGYQVCRFCWHHIKEDLNGLCPACRREYTEEMVQFKPVSPEEMAQLKAKRKAKLREKKEQENNAKKHYANVRVIQKNLVYVIGLPSYVANEETIKQYDYFGQYGKITKVVINKKTHSPHQSTVGIYITYSKKEEAEKAIEAVDNLIFDGRQVKASYGTTKYCTFYLRGQTCQNPQCMYLHEPGEEIESKEDLLSKTQILTSQSSVSHVKEVKQPVPPKAIRTTIYREKDETSALPATANWGSRKPKLDDGEKKAISIRLSDILTKSNENSKLTNINLSRSKSDSQSSLKIKTEGKIKPISTIKSHSEINITSIKNELMDENSNSEKIDKLNNNRDEEYPALSSVLNRKNNNSKEGRSSSHSSLIMSPQTTKSKLNSINKSKETIENPENINKPETDTIDTNNLITNDDNEKIINEDSTENIPKTESPIPTKEEIEIKSEEKSEIDNDINEASKKMILEEISKAYSYDQTLASSNVLSSPSTTSSSSFNLFAELSKSPSENSKDGKTKTNSPPPGFENKMESRASTPNMSKSDFKINDPFERLNQSIADLKISDDEVVNDSSSHINEFKYNGPFDPFNEVLLNNLMNVNAIMNNYSKHYLNGFGGYNGMLNNVYNGMNQMNPLINESNFAPYQNQLNQKYLEQYYQNLNREQIQNNLRAMLPNVNISPYSNGNENNPWSNQASQTNFNDDLFNNYNSMAAAMNGNNMFFNNFNNINFMKQLQMTQMLNNMKKMQQIENNLSMSNNINMNNSQDFKSLPFKDSAIMAVKMSNNSKSIDNSSQMSNNINTMNVFQNLNMKPNDVTNNVGYSLNPVSPMNAFANLNHLNQINGINSLNNNMSNVNQIHNIHQMNDISSMNMNLASNSLTSPIVPSLATMNNTNFNSMNMSNKEGLGGLTTSVNSIYEDDQMKFFQKLSEINKDGRENKNMNPLPDFWKSKIQDTGGGNDEKSDLLTDSILEKRFNEAEQKSIQYNKKSKDETKIQNDSNKIKSMNDTKWNENFNLESNSSINIDQLNENSINKNIDDKVLEKINAKKEILDIFTKKNKNDNVKENQKSETVKTLELKRNNISDVETTIINKHNSNKSFEETNEIQEKENIDNNNIINKITVPKMKNKEKKEVSKLDTKKEFPMVNKNETAKSEPLIIKFEPKKIKKEKSKEEELKKEPLIKKLEEKKAIKEEPMTLVISKKSKKEEKLVNKKEEKQVLKKIIKNEENNENVNLVNQTNMFEILPDVTLSSNNTDIDKIENNKTSLLKINQEIVKEQETSKSIQVINSTKKNKKKAKHKKKKTSSKETSYEEDIDLINKELDLNEKKNNEGTSQSKKKKKSKKKNNNNNNDIELHILTVNDNKTQLMKETQLYRLPLTAIAKKLIPENSGTTLGLKPVFPPDIEIEALCNVIVTKRSKKKKRDDLNLPFLHTKIGQLKSELENEKIDFNYIDEVNENVSIERNDDRTNMMEQKGIDILKNHNMEVNMITSLKQIKRGALKGKIELKNDNNLGDIVEKLSEDFLDEEDIDDIKENLNMNSERLVDMKITNEIVENQKLTELNKQISENDNSSPNPESQFFVFQALDALINTAEVYANALKKQIEEYERKDYNLEDSNKYSNNYKRKVKIYEAVLESIKDIREMGLSDYKNLEKLCFSDMKGDDNYEDNISNLLISVKYIMQELVLNVDEQEVLPQILTLNKNTNTLLSRMNGNKFKDSVLEQYKKLFEENHNNSQKIENHNDNSLNNNSSDNNLTAQEDNKKQSNKMDTVFTSMTPHNSNPPKDIDKVEYVNTINNNDMPEIIEPESLKIVNQSITNFLKDYNLDETNKKIKVKKNQKEQPSTSNIELKIEYENEEVKNKIEKMSKSNTELLYSTEDILLELILKSQENQELKTKLISNCLNLDVNLAKKLAASLRMKGKDKEKSLLMKKTEVSKFKNRIRDYPNPNEKVEITLVDGEIVVKKVSEIPNNHELKKKKKEN